jgi:hypothetical protein
VIDQAGDRTFGSEASRIWHFPAQIGTFTAQIAIPALAYDVKLAADEEFQPRVRSPLTR